MSSRIPHGRWVQFTKQESFGSDFRGGQRGQLAHGPMIIERAELSVLGRLHSPAPAPAPAPAPVGLGAPDSGPWDVAACSLGHQRGSAGRAWRFRRFGGAVMTVKRLASRMLAGLLAEISVMGRGKRNCRNGSGDGWSSFADEYLVVNFSAVSIGQCAGEALRGPRVSGVSGIWGVPVNAVWVLLDVWSRQWVPCLVRRVCW